MQRDLRDREEVFGTGWLRGCVRRAARHAMRQRAVSCLRAEMADSQALRQEDNGHAKRVRECGRRRRRRG